MIGEAAIRERRRGRRVLRARLRARLDALGRWWVTFGEALLPFTLGAIAAVPGCAGLVVWALWGWA